MLTGVINLRSLVASKARLNAALRRQRSLVARSGDVIASPYLYKGHREGKRRKNLGNQYIFPGGEDKKR
jgi:hypothetical protein